MTNVDMTNIEKKPVRIGIAGLSHDHVFEILRRPKRGDVEVVGIAEADRALAERYAQFADALEKDMREGRLPEMLVVVPRGVGTWFVDSSGGGSRYATFLNRTLVPYVDARYRTVASRGSRLVAGISMGGYGAFKTAFAYPERFAAAASFSGALSVEFIRLHPDDARRHQGQHRHFGHAAFREGQIGAISF